MSADPVQAFSRASSLSLSLLSSTVWLKDSKARISLETTQHYFYSSPKQLASSGGSSSAYKMRIEALASFVMLILLTQLPFLLLFS